jgi:hypothetical protein
MKAAVAVEPRNIATAVMVFTMARAAMEAQARVAQVVTSKQEPGIVVVLAAQAGFIFIIKRKRS